MNLFQAFGHLPRHGDQDLQTPLGRNLSAYDALDVALAEDLSLPLVSADARLA